MADIVLIIPVSKTEISPLVYPPLGMLYIAAALIKDGHHVNIYDMREVDNNIENIPEAEFYGFTAVTPQIHNVLDCAQHLREHTNAFLFIGGPHASCFPLELAPLFDAIVVGEGEKAVCDVVAHKIHGIVELAPTDINDILFPARHLMCKNKIVNSELWEGYGYGTGPKATTVITSRGCPWQCAFCANIPQKIRFRSADNLVEEINLIISEYGCRNFRFIDDNFIMNKKRLRELSNKLHDLNISFRCAGRTDILTDEICELLVLSGCKEIGFGIEAADDDILHTINKNETVKDHETAVLLAKKHGLQTKGFFMAGLPGETWDTIKKNKAFIKNVGLDKVIVTLFTPYPGCQIWSKPEKFGIKIIEKDWNKYYQTYPSRSAIESGQVSNSEFTEHFDEFIDFVRRRQTRRK